MGAIVGLGLSHYPPLRGADDAMAGILRRTLTRSDVPDAWKKPENWPAPMRQEWGADEGRSAAPRHRAELVKHLKVLRQALDDFKPDFVLMWGDDQYENFHEDITPAFCVYAYDDMEVYPYRPRHRAASTAPTGEGGGLSVSESSASRPAPNAWGEGADVVVRIPGKRDAAKWLVRELLTHEHIDMAYSYKPLHYDGLSHAFLNGVMYLDYERKGWPYPLVAMAINCYGSRVNVNRGGVYPVGSISIPEADLDPPSPSPDRCMEVGAAVARALARSPWKVALVASSSWSHAFLTPKHYFVYPDVDNDRRLYEALAAGDFDTWRKVTEAEVVDRGQQEVLNWWALMGAMEALGHKTPAYHGYVESYVMNSNKAFAIYHPR
jgi:hypothetical protein